MIEKIKDYIIKLNNFEDVANYIRILYNKLNEIINSINENNDKFDFKSNSKAILEFNLNDDKDSFTLASKGDKYYSCLWDISSYLRELIKYVDLSNKEYKQVEEIRSKFYEILEENQCSLDDVS